VDGELDLVGGEAEGQPGRISHWERAVELCHKCVEVLCESGSGGGSVGDQEGDRASFVDLSGDSQGEGTVCIPKDACCNVRGSGSNQDGLAVFRGGRSRSVEPPFCRRERLGGRDLRH